MLSQAVQDYIKAIYKLQENGLVSTTELSNHLNISGASVTGMVKKMSAMGIVEYNSYKGVRLTPAGEKIALEIIRHHRLLELYLKEVMGFSLEKVHEEACRMEHVISTEFADKLNELLGDPKFDPHGHPIPTKFGTIDESIEKAINDYPEGTSLIIRSLFDEDPKLLAYLEEINLVPNVIVKILKIEPFYGPIIIQYDNTERVIGHEVASCIFVDEVSGSVLM